MNPEARQRARLSLRAERAFGLCRRESARAGSKSRRRPGSPPAAAIPPESRTRQAASVKSPAQAAAAPDVSSQAIPPQDSSQERLDAAAFRPSRLTRRCFEPEEKRRRLMAMDENEVRGCTKCRLCETRTQTVFGDGDADAKIFFIGEGPGETEDLQGGRSSAEPANCSTR